MSWWCMWPLLLMAVNAESVYWSTSARNRYSFGFTCRPKFGNEYCGDWDIGGWNIVRSFEVDLPPVLDYRWNDLQRFVEPRGKITHNKLLLNSSAQHLYIPVSLLVRNSAVVILRSGNEDWRFAIDAQIKSEPKVGVELWKWNTITESSDIVGATHIGRVLHNGTRWTTVLLKYEARSQGDTLKLYNPESRMEIMWKTKQTINSVKELRFYSHRDSPGLFGHWRFHLYDIIVPNTNGNRLQLSHRLFLRENRFCISITYIAPHTNLPNNEGYVQLYSRDRNNITTEEIKLNSTGNEWKTVKQSLSSFLDYPEIRISISPPATNIEGFAIGEIRACSVGEFRVSRIASSAASECTDLKRNITVKLKSAVINHQELDILENSTLYYKKKCVGIIPNIQDCRGVTFCSSSVCTCAPGYQGHDCQHLVCPMGFYGSNCTLNCNRNCNGAICNSITGKCSQGCIANWAGDTCEECEDGRFGINCSSLCGSNCMEYCNKENGSCMQGCKPGWKGDTCNKACDLGLYGIGCRKKCGGKCKDDEICNAVDGHCPNGCEDGFAGDKCDSQPLSTLSIIFIPIEVLAFVLMGIVLIYLFFWIVRLRRRLESYQIKSVDNDQLPPICHFQQDTMENVNTQRNDSAVCDEICEDVEYETIKETGAGPQLDVKTGPNSVRYIVSGKSTRSTCTRNLEIEVDYENTMSAKPGSSGQPPTIPILPGDEGSQYADVLNLSDNQTVAEYEYIRHEGVKI